MPDKKTHLHRNHLFAFILSSGCFIYCLNKQEAEPLIIIGGFLLNTYWSHSDRDQSRKGFWLIYGAIMPHRSPYSHWPVLATAMRNVYIGFVAVPVYYVYNNFLHRVGLQWIPTTQQAFYFFFGQCVADAFHLVWDKEDTNTKIAWRKRRKGNKR